MNVLIFKEPISAAKMELSVKIYLVLTCKQVLEIHICKLQFRRRNVYYIVHVLREMYWLARDVVFARLSLVS